jgi:hypothetical protein
MSPQNSKMKTGSQFLVGLMIVIALSSCGSIVDATSNKGEILEGGKEYGYVRMKAINGKADYNVFMNVYFGHPVDKNDKVVLTTQRYLDSLLLVTKNSVQ